MNEQLRSYDEAITKLRDVLVSGAESDAAVLRTEAGVIDDSAPPMLDELEAALDECGAVETQTAHPRSHRR
jgi:hypothetical protein